MIFSKLDSDEKIINEYRPPKRAIIYSFIKNSPIKFIVIIVIFYYISGGLYSFFDPQKKLITYQEKPTFSTALKPLEITNTGDKSYSINKSGTIQGGGSSHSVKIEVKPYFSVVVAFFLLCYLLLQLRKQKHVLNSTLYTVTNKKIISVSTYPKQKMESIRYIDNAHCSILQTPLHWLFKIYFVCLSPRPVPNTMFNAISAFRRSSSEVLDILTVEQANNFAGIFKGDHKGQVGLADSTIKTQSNTIASTSFPGHDLVNIKSSSRYLLLLIPRYFKKACFAYGIPLAFLLFAMHQFGNFHVPYPRELILGFVLLVLILSYVAGEYRVNKFEYTFNKDQLSFQKNFSTKINIPYKDILKVNINPLRFNLYQVELTLKNGYQFMDENYCIPGLSKETAEKILHLIHTST